MFIAAIVLAGALEVPSLAQVQQLPPLEAGKLLLQDKIHLPIESVIEPKVIGIGVPGMVQLQLIEGAVARANGCVRMRWTASFFFGPGVTRSAAKFSNVYRSTEVALRGAGPCPADKYVHLNWGIEPEQALDALRYLDDIRFRGGNARFSCTDNVASGLCRNSQTIRRELARETLWVVMRKAEVTTFWLGSTGQTFTQVSYNESSPKRIVIKRDIPPPF